MEVDEVRRWERKLDQLRIDHMQEVQRARAVRLLSVRAQRRLCELGQSFQQCRSELLRDAQRGDDIQTRKRVDQTICQLRALKQQQSQVEAEVDRAERQEHLTRRTLERISARQYKVAHLMLDQQRDSIARLLHKDQAEIDDRIIAKSVSEKIGCEQSDASSFGCDSALYGNELRPQSSEVHPGEVSPEKSDVLTSNTDFSSQGHNNPSHSCLKEAQEILARIEINTRTPGPLLDRVADLELLARQVLCTDARQQVRAVTVRWQLESGGAVAITVSHDQNQQGVVIEIQTRTEKDYQELVSKRSQLLEALGERGIAVREFLISGDPDGFRR